MKRYILGTLAVLGIVCGTGALIYAWKVGEINEKLKEKIIETPLYEVIKTSNSFLQGVLYEEKRADEIVSEEEKRLRAEKKNFIKVNLDAMELTLFDKGVSSGTLKVVSKGKDGSFWETPTGAYEARYKETNHFSSIGKVWMPWSIQFYGNFFIHGLPYYEDGTPVRSGYSGGCIRLSTSDAAKVFEFVELGTPILVLDTEQKRVIVPKLKAENDINLGETTAKAALVADIETGEIFVNKNADEVLPIASLTKLMTATVASELIYLERSQVIEATMIKDLIQSHPLKVGERYKAFDLFYPLLIKSSNGASEALAGFLGRGTFISYMNEKAKALGMQNTVFRDPSGVEEGNASTLKEIALLVKYILEKRYFILDITKGKGFDSLEESNFLNGENYNEFATNTNLVGMKNGESTGAGQTLASLWSLQAKDGTYRNIFIGVLGSSDRKKDTEVLFDWLKQTYELQ